MFGKHLQMRTFSESSMRALDEWNRRINLRLLELNRQRVVWCMGLVVCDIFSLILATYSWPLASGTGKFLLACVCADGAKLLVVRDVFALAKEKAPAIIFIDELDAISTKRFDSNKDGDREEQRTMLELLNQSRLDGFGSDDRIKVGPCPETSWCRRGWLWQWWRLLPLPAESTSWILHFYDLVVLPNDTALAWPRSLILQIHSRKMATSSDVN